MANSLKIIENKCTIEIENKKYYLYESYIVNGTGYTFRIYANSKYSRERSNCFWSLSSDRIVILGEKYNYILYRKNDSFEFDNIKFDKNTLRFDILKLNSHKLYSICLNESELFCYGENERNSKLWDKEINNRNKIIRKQKLINLDNA